MGWAWGCDEFMVGRGKSDTRGEVLCEKDGSGGCLPGGPGQGSCGAWGLRVCCEASGPGDRAHSQRGLETRGQKHGRSGAGKHLGEEDEQGWETHCQAFMAW